MTESIPRIAEFILCEEIRDEVGGKVSLMGLYRDQISFVNGGDAGWPRPLRHAVYIRVNNLHPQDFQFEIEVKMGKSILFRYQGDVKQPAKSPKTEIDIKANLSVLVPGFGEVVTSFRLLDPTHSILLEQVRPILIVPFPAEGGPPE